MPTLIETALTRAGQLAESPATLADAQLLTALVTALENAAREEPWRQVLRDELAKPEYATAVANQDAAAALALLRVTRPTFPDPIPVAAVRADLVRADFAATAAGAGGWTGLLERVTTRIATATVVSRADVVPLLEAAVNGSGPNLPAILPAGYQAGRVDQSRLDELRLTAVVTDPIFVRRAMGW